MPAAALARAADDTSTASLLLDVAERLFAERGIASVSLRQIVLEGGQATCRRRTTTSARATR